MTTPLPPYLEREKLISELLIAFKRLLPNLTKGHEIKKIKHEIEYHERMLTETKLLISGELLPEDVESYREGLRENAT